MSNYENGVNAMPYNGLTVDDLNGFAYVRFPLWLVDPVTNLVSDTRYVYMPIIESILSKGEQWIQIVLDRRSFPTNEWAKWLRQLKNWYPMINWWQPCNEWDSPRKAGSESSWSMSNHRVDTIVNATRRVMGDSHFITLGGVVSADGPQRLAELTCVKYCDAVSFHPYGLRPSASFPTAHWGFGNLTDAYDAVSAAVPGDMQIEMSEYGGDIRMFNDEHQRAQYFTQMITKAYDLGINRGAVYCLNKRQSAELGIVEADGTQTESYAAVHDAGRVLV